MVEAYVLVTIAIGKVHDVIEELKKHKCVAMVDAVTGPYDAIIRLDAKDLGELTKTVIQEIHKIDGVIDTTTAIVIEI
ncbi:MAG: Lrp/AsnC ligand binding domain-containing protein [Candidatus Methanofastidiosa archaeon]|nr:Lrp/AsnC ligand binding domain-containing protein [Candidatus Methanofastidiosa archaeon]